VAEGVETADAWNLLAAWDCDDAQGFLMGKPMDAKDFPAWRAHYETRTAVHGAEIV
jgi:EAL domain-containing protein (putative c-di-GMP-specific phosphodiesterase class I)